MMWPAIFADKARGNRITYWTWAVSGADAEANTGALADGGGSAFITPGRKNVAGETEPLALMPEHPVPHQPPTASNTSIASRADFQFNLTCPV